MTNKTGPRAGAGYSCTTGVLATPAAAAAAGRSRSARSGPAIQQDCMPLLSPAAEAPPTRGPAGGRSVMARSCGS